MLPPIASNRKTRIEARSPASHETQTSQMQPRIVPKLLQFHFLTAVLWSSIQRAVFATIHGRVQKVHPALLIEILLCRRSQLQARSSFLIHPGVPAYAGSSMSKSFMKPRQNYMEEPACVCSYGVVSPTLVIYESHGQILAKQLVAAEVRRAGVHRR